MEKKIFVIYFFIFSLFSLNVSAEILISSPESIYNYGDSFNIKVTLREPIGISAPFSLDLKCENGEKNLMKISQLWIKKDEEKLTHDLFFFKPFLKDLKGECKIVAKFGNEIKESSPFILSNKINVVININNSISDPGEFIEVKGEAKKENGKNVEGIVEALLMEKNNSKVLGSDEVKNGKFLISFKVPENLPARTYKVIIFVYETQDNNISNFGNVTMKLKIKQKPKRIDIAIIKQNFKPGNNITFSTTIYDQANEKMSGNVNIKIYDPKERLVVENLIDSDSKYIFHLEKNATPGYWKIIGEAYDIAVEKNFFVDKLEEADFKIEENTLIIKNVGNVVYNKSIEIKIDSYKKILKIVLGVGEEKHIRLNAPKGIHNISINEGNKKVDVKNIYFSGFAGYSIKIIEEKKSNIKYSSIIIFIFLLIIFFVIKKVKIKEKNKIDGDEVAVNKKNEEEYVVSKEVNEAERVLVLKGIKENVVFLGLKIENLENIKNVVKESLEKIKEKIKESGGAIYTTQNYIIAIYTSLNTKTLNNEGKAIDTAKKLRDIISEHNKKFKEKIKYGMCIVKGDVVIKKEEKIKFIPLNNVLNFIKKMLDLSKDEILLSEKIYRKEMSNVRAIKKIIDNIKVYSLQDVRKEEYKKFINDFLRRNKELFEEKFKNEK